MTDATDTTTTTPAASMTPDQAGAKLAELQADPDWTKALLSGSGPQVKEFHQLMEAKGGADRIDQALAGIEPPSFETVTDGKLSTRNMIKGIEHLREVGVEEKQIGRLLRDEPISAEDRAGVVRYEKELLGDAEFVKKWLAGDYTCHREMMTIKLHLLRPVAEEEKK